MASGATTKYALPYPLDTDPPNIPGDVEALANAIDAILAPYAQDVAANRPAAAKAGRTFTQTDQLAGITWRDDGATWRALGSRVQPNATNDVAQIVRAITGQTADLQQWQNSSGSRLSSVAADGGGYFPTLGLGVAGPAPSGGVPLTVVPAAAGDIAAIFAGQTAQTANLTEWRNVAGTVLAKIDASGVFTASQAFLGGFGTGSGVLNVQSQGVGQIVEHIRAASGQTANLTQWENSAGTVMASVTAAGSAQFSASLVAKATAAYSGTNDLQQWQDLNANVVSRMTPDGRMTLNPGLLASFDQSQVNTTLLVGAKSTTGIGAVVRAFSGQTADIAQWQSSAGNAVASVNNVGTIVAGQSLFVADRAANGYGVMSSMSNAASVPFVAKGASAQSANLQEWQNSAGTVLAQVENNGYLRSSVGVKAGGDSGTYAVLHAVVSDTTPANNQRGLVVKGISGQTANLTEWQQSNGAVSSYVEATGTMHAPTFYATATDNPSLRNTSRTWVIGSYSTTPYGALDAITFTTYASGGCHVFNYYPTSGDGIAVYNGNYGYGTARAASFVNPSSDAYKSDVRHIGHGLDTLKKLQPKRYKFAPFEVDASGHPVDGFDRAPEGYMKTGQNGSQYHILNDLESVGFIAEDVKLHFPEAYHEDDGGVFLDYNRFVPLIVSSIHDIDAVIDSLRTRVGALESAAHIVNPPNVPPRPNV